jgi:hypothetical protein
LLAVVVASLVMYFPLMMLHQGNINAGGTGFGDPQLSAPQAGLMAICRRASSAATCRGR